MSTETTSKSLSGKGLMQSVGEWSARNDALSAALSELVRTHGPANGGLGLDVGCQNGALTDAWERLTDLHWTGIDPGIEHELARGIEDARDQDLAVGRLGGGGTNAHERPPS